MKSINFYVLFRFFFELFFISKALKPMEKVFNNITVTVIRDFLRFE